MMDILYYLFYTERKTKPTYETQREEEEKGVTKKRLKKCVFSSGGNGEGKKKKRKVTSGHKKEVMYFQRSLSTSSQPGTSLMARQLRIQLPMQGTWAGSLVEKDSTCHGETKPGYCNHWSLRTLEPRPETHRRDRPGAVDGGQPGRSRGDPAQPNTQTDKIMLKHENCKREREKFPAWSPPQPDSP